jgi:glycosyltransferase involved in cell wall biosynthesis
VRLLMMNFSLYTADATDSPLSLVKFLLPLEHDALSLPATLTLIDTVCHRGALAHEIVAVDDASQDGTATEARRFSRFMPLWLIQQGQPTGRAAAFRAAVAAACRDAGDDDLLIPIDPRRRPTASAVLNAVEAARDGWSAVLAPSGRSFGRDQAEPCPDEVAVYRAGLVKRHLRRFLDSLPSRDGEAVRQLESYFLSAGVSFHQLPAPSATRRVLLPVFGGIQADLRIASGRGKVGLNEPVHG